MSLNNKRLLHIDVLKIISIYMVLFNHTGVNGFVYFTVAKNSVMYPFYMFNSILIKVAVPLFFMTSGALLLSKEESYKTIICKRFSKYALILIIASAIEYLYFCLRINHQKVLLLDFLKTLYTSTHATAYWYLYTYLAYILMLPLLRKLAKAMEKRDYFWMALMFLLVNFLSIIDFLIWKGDAGHNGSFNFFITSSYVVYPLMGYYYEYKASSQDFTKKRLAQLVLASIVSIVFCCIMTQYKCTLFDEWNEASCQTFFVSLIYIPTITMYYGIKMWFLNHEVGDKSRQLITTIGSTTFGIFLIENICRYETKWIFNMLQPLIRTLPACWVWIFFACCMGFIITYLLKKIPGMKYFI